MIYQRNRFIVEADRVAVSDGDNVQLVEDYLKAKSLATRTALIRGNLYLVGKVICSRSAFWKQPEDRVNDLFQVGSLVLIWCVDRYEKGRCSFRAFVVSTLRQGIMAAYRQAHGIYRGGDGKRPGAVRDWKKHPTPEPMPERLEVIDPRPTQYYVDSECRMDATKAGLERLSEDEFFLIQRSILDGDPMRIVCREAGLGKRTAYKVKTSAIQKLAEHLGVAA